MPCLLWHDEVTCQSLSELTTAVLVHVSCSANCTGFQRLRVKSLLDMDGCLLTSYGVLATHMRCTCGLCMMHFLPQGQVAAVGLQSARAGQLGGDRRYVSSAGMVGKQTLVASLKVTQLSAPGRIRTGGGCSVVYVVTK
jgi:hypothetical protein